MPVRTLTLLWQFLTGCLENVEMRTDLFIDLFYLLPRISMLLLNCAQFPIRNFCTFDKHE